MALDNLVQDLRYTARTLRRDAGFTTFAILIAGLGIGASATVFSVVNTLLLRPLPFAEPRAAGVDRQPRHQRAVGPDHAGRTHAGPARADAVAVGDRRLLRVLRRRRQPAQRQGRARAAERRAGVRQLLRRARREAAARPRVQRGRVRVERAEGGAARATASGSGASTRIPAIVGTLADAQRRAAHRRRRAAGVVRFRDRSSRRAATSICTSRSR